MSYAIIGLGFRFPGGNNDPTTLYENLKEGNDCVETIPKDRWNKDFFHSKDYHTPGKMVNQRCGFVHPYYDFDPECFFFSKREAMSMDPTLKIFLETALETLEDSNVKYKGTKTGVFLGTGQQGFVKYATQIPEFITEYTATGTNIGVHSNMISYKFDLRGPSISLDTACSASGSALYLAINSFDSGDIDMALVGGFNHLINYAFTVAFSRLGVLSPDGMCKCFDEKANGYVRSEGCGMILVKPLKKAIEDGNYVYAVIKGVSSNEDGSLEKSLTKPSSEAQEILMRRALEKSKLDGKDVFYVEAHATGTAVGDPAEVNTIGKVFGFGRNQDNILRLGSVKRNLGHLEIASFMASIIKCCLMISNQNLVPTPVEKINPKLEMKKFNMKVQTKNEKFDPHNKYFVINSFGFGGANACAVLEGFCNEKVLCDDKDKITPPYLFIVDGRTKKNLELRITQYKNFSVKDEHQLSYTLNTFVREGARFISFGIGKTFSESRFYSPIRISEKKSRLCFVFSGQGPQNLGMGRILYKKFPVFKRIIDKCDGIYKKFAGFSLIHDVGMFGEKVADIKDLVKISITLPSLLFTQIGLWELWKHFGLKPDYIIGHSFGEMCSLYATGSLSLETILEVAYARGKICESLDNQGKMIAIGSGVESIEKIIEENGLKQLWICADNSPVSCTVGGKHESVEKLDKICEELKIFHRVLKITNAFHTPLLNPMKETAEKTFPSLSDSKLPEIRFFSTVLGNFWDAPFSKSYLWENIAKPVQFRSAIEGILGDNDNIVFLEIAPHPVLALSMKQCGAKQVLSSIKRGGDEQVSILETCGRLIGYDINLNWDNVMGKRKRLRNVPRYPFHRVPCFMKISEMENRRFVNENVEDNKKNKNIPLIPRPLLGRLQNITSRTWLNLVNTKKFKYLEDHVVQKTVVYPAAGYIEQCLEICEKFSNSVKNVKVLNPIVVPTKQLNYILMETKIENGGKKVKVCSKKYEPSPPSSSSWTENAVCEFVPKLKIEDLEKKEKIYPQKIEILQEKLKKVVKQKEIYEKLELVNLFYGPFFKLLDKMYIGDGEVLISLNSEKLKEDEDFDRYIVHPTIIDAGFQALELTLKDEIKSYLPTFVKKFKVYKTKFTPGEVIYIHSVSKFKSKEKVIGDIFIFNQKNLLIAKMIDVEISSVTESVEKGKTQLTLIWQTKNFPDVEMEEVFPKGEKFGGFDKFSRNFEEIERNIMEIIQPNLKRLRGLNIPKVKHNFLNWINKKSVEADLELKKDVKLNKIEGYKEEFELLENLCKYFNQIMRKKGVDKENRLNLIEKFLNDSQYYRTMNEKMEKIIEKVMGFTKSRVLRILEISRNPKKSFFRMFQKYSAEKDERIEVFFSSSPEGEDVEKLKKKIQKFKNFEYKKLDIDQPDFPENQSVLKNYFDLVIGIDINFEEKGLNNLEKIMVQNGNLVLFQSKFRFLENFVFGLVNDNWVEKKHQIITVNVETLSKLFNNLNFNSKVVDLDSFYFIINNKKTDKIENGEIRLNSVGVFEDSSSIKLLDFVKKDKKDKPLFIVTKGVYFDEYSTDFAANVGFGRVINNEYEDWKVKLIDFDSKISQNDQSKWINYLASKIDEIENEIVVRDEVMFVPRLVKIVSEKADDDKFLNVSKDCEYYRLFIDNPGQLNTLNYHEIEKPVLGEDDVLVKVHAAALNFKDIMLAMNMLDLEKKLGLEFSGKITEIGKNVSEFKVGDEVFGFADYSLSSYVKTTKFLITKKPGNITHEEACSIPTVFSTPFHALVKKAGIQKGDNVLVHSAAGGVGQACIQLCKLYGATVIATVGTKSKRLFLEKEYGVKIFGDSHSVSWDKEILGQLQPGEGVDVILNSLAGDNIERGVKLLKPFGSFIEIGKRDIMQNSPIFLAPFLENLSYYSVHLDKMIEKDPKRVGRLLNEIKVLFEQKKIIPVVDSTFESSDVLKAFRHMQSGKHRGKIVVNFFQPKIAEKKLSKFGIFSGTKNYVISGGLGVIGFKLCEWMISEGARNLILLSRSGRKSKYQKQIFEKYQNSEVNLVVSKTDVSSSEGVAEMYDKIGGKIGGILHLATVYRDGAIPIQTREMFEESFSAKIFGAKNLVENLPSGDKPDFIIFFSSIASTVGNLEQANYCASNSFLDIYAHHLSFKNRLNSKVVNLGAVVDVGIIAEDLKLRKILKHGLLDIESGMKISQVFDTIKQMVLDKKNVQFIPELNLHKVVKRYLDHAPKYSHLIDKAENLEESGDKSQSSKVSVESVKSFIAELLSVDVKDIANDEKLTTYGVDSLISVEISQTLKGKFGIKISQIEILSGATINQIMATLK